MTDSHTRNLTASAVSLAVAGLAFTGHSDAALTLAAGAFTWLQASTHGRVQRVEASVGPSNGENVHELLNKLVELEAYTRTRNHDILGALTPSNARLELDLLELLDRVPKPSTSTEGTDHP